MAFRDSVAAYSLTSDFSSPQLWEQISWLLKSSGVWQLVITSHRSVWECCLFILPLLHSSLKNAVWLLRKYSTKLGDMASKTDFTAHRLNGIKSNLGSWILSLIVRENRNTNMWHTGSVQWLRVVRSRNFTAFSDTSYLTLACSFLLPPCCWASFLEDSILFSSTFSMNSMILVLFKLAFQPCTFFVLFFRLSWCYFASCFPDSLVRYLVAYISFILISRCEHKH